VDLIAKSPEELLAQLDGRSINRFDGGAVRLELHNAQRTALGMSARQKFLSRIVQPDVFFILLIVGVLGLYAEFTHPGMVAPGVIGGISLLLALYAMHILPINFAGLLLIVLALALFILEAKFTSHGVLGIGGVVAMLLGALMLIRSPLTAAGVSLGVALGVTLPFAVLTIVLMRLVLRSRGWKQATGVEQLVGAQGEVTEAFEVAGHDGASRGMVLVHGELWRAIAREKIGQGVRVRVVRVDGLTLEVEPAERRPGSPA
jgi:membrane-bound serine protease (ClpP class)